MFPNTDVTFRAATVENLLHRYLEEGATQVASRLASGEPARSVAGQAECASKAIVTTDRALGRKAQEAAEALAALVEKSEERREDMFKELDGMLEAV